MKVKEYPNQATINKLFTYSDGMLFWKATNNQVTTIKEAGNIRSDGYRRIKIKGKNYYANRLVFIMFFGDIPKGKDVDHIDANKLNNSIDNLRLLSHLQNKIRTSKGYSWSKQSNKWRTRIMYIGTSYSLGEFTNEQDARDTYLKTRLFLYSI